MPTQQPLGKQARELGFEGLNILDELLDRRVAQWLLGLQGVCTPGTQPLDIQNRGAWPFQKPLKNSGQVANPI
ncbi:hypothetical protein [Corallococcus sp. CA054B]|uniref:hypothetical protein n=1 Tax=Corallococcus sp. CA054B TaxID=2316734 RepID=UPI0011C3B583|nr:hypothetical protein [Corallococcus sp. CA054B]